MAQAEDEFKEKIFSGFKENLIFSMLSYLWIRMLSELPQEEKASIEKNFISVWKKNLSEVTQSQLSSINNILNDGNIDMLNIITGHKEIADVEDYQQIINENIQEAEKIFWKICGK